MEHSFFYIYVAWNEETRLRAPKTKFEFFDDFERQKHALSNGPMHKAVRSKVTEIGYRIIRIIRLPSIDKIIL